MAARCFRWNKSIPQFRGPPPCCARVSVTRGKEKEQMEIQRFENGGRRPFPFGGVQSTRKSGSPRLLHFRMSLVRHGGGGGGGHRELICPGEKHRDCWRPPSRFIESRSTRGRHVTGLCFWDGKFFVSLAS